MQKPSREQRQQALYGATCIHASFGDVEVAQTTLRGCPLFSLELIVQLWSSHCMLTLDTSFQLL